MASTRKLDKNTLHIEANGCIVNIRENLTDHLGRNVTAVEIIPNGDRYAGELPWKLHGSRNNRIVQLKNIPKTRNRR